MTVDQAKIKIRNDYNYMVTTFDYMEYVSTYLGYIIDNLEEDEENFTKMSEIMLEFKQLYSMNQDKMIRFSDEIDKLYNTLKVNDSEFELDRLMGPTERLIALAQKQLNNPATTENAVDSNETQE
jgi:hypothetical protein